MGYADGRQPVSFDFKQSFKLCILVIILCQRFNISLSQRIDRITCERRPTHTTALKTSGDNGFSIKILATSHSTSTEYYVPGHDYKVLLNGSYANQQFLDFMLVATLKSAANERQTAGTFTHMLNHMTKEDSFCNHVLTSITFHPSYKKSSATFIWTAPPKGSGCVLFKATVIEHPDIWFSNDGGLTKMFCEKPQASPAAPTANAAGKEGGSGSTHTKRRSNKCCACDTAKYEVTFVGNWSRETHPKGFPVQQHESLLHWSDIIGASHSPSYSVWSYDTLASTGVKEVCEYGWPRTLEGEIKQKGRDVRTVIKAKGVWGYPAIYTTRRSARFSTDNERPYMSLLTMVGPSPDWCIGIDSLNMCLEDCTWLDKTDVDLYPWDAGTDSGVTYLSKNLPTYPKEKIRRITNRYPNNTASPFYGSEKVLPMGKISIRRVGSRSSTNSGRRCDASGTGRSSSGSEESSTDGSASSVKCMVTEWSAFTSCDVTCGVGMKTRTRRFKHPMGTFKTCPHVKLQERDNCLGLVNECKRDPNEHVDVCVTTPWSNWNPCSVSCGTGSRLRTRQYFNPMGPRKCSVSLTDSSGCSAAILDCSMAKTNWMSVCKLDADAGVCKGNFTRFFYDINMRKCRPFQYGGCRGNQNKFDSSAECDNACTAAFRRRDLCKLAADAGSCKGNFRRFFYDTNMKKCRPFQYGGCRGNQNKFDSVEECNTACAIIMATTDGGSQAVSPARNKGGRGTNCMLTEWTSFSDCTVTCGTGLRTRSRQIKARNTGSGAACPKDLYDSQVCTSECPPAGSQDCMLSEWGDWSDCSSTCGDGVQFRLRMVKRPAKGSGRPCERGLKEMKACYTRSCLPSSQCMLAEWMPWSRCSVACGVGKKMRRRLQKRGPCPDDTVYTAIEPCDGSQCGNVTAVDCVITQWSAWTRCDKTCGNMGSQTRFRMIRQPAAYGGRCAFNEPKQMEQRACYLGACPSPVPVNKVPIDCQIGQWSPWTSCSKTCGTGRQVRRRKMIRRRRNGGKKCPSHKEARICVTGVRCRKRRRRL